MKGESVRGQGPKGRIIETACRLFYVQGYNNTGINQILDEAKVAKASLYQHYKSKEDVGIEYLKLARAEWFEGLDQWTTKKNTSSQKVLACFDFLEYALTHNEYRGCKFINILAELADGSSAIRQQVVEHKSKLREYIKNYVNEARREQGLEKSENIGDAVYLLFEGAIVESKIYKDAWPTKTAKKIVKTLIQGS
jgi:AcrR family transcriptional regulator